MTVSFWLIDLYKVCVILFNYAYLVLLRYVTFLHKLKRQDTAEFFLFKMNFNNTLLYVYLSCFSK